MPAGSLATTPQRARCCRRRSLPRTSPKRCAGLRRIQVVKSGGHRWGGPGHPRSPVNWCAASTGCGASVETISSAPDSNPHAPVATRSRVTASA